MASKSLKDKLKEKRENLKSKGGGFKTFVIKEGTTRFRNVPVGDEKDWSLETTCFFLGKELGLVVSPHTFGEKCAFMEKHNELNNSKDTADREFAKKKLRPSRKFFTAVVRYKDEQGKEIDEENGVKPLVLTPSLVQDMIDLYLDEEEAGDFTDPVNGYDIKFTRTGKGQMDTEYSIRSCKPTKLKGAFGKKVYDLEAMIREMTPSYKETKEMLKKYMALPDEEVPAATEDTPKKKKKKSKDL